ncbi:hypothetical protein ACHAWF_003954 [Thalassiosira exigua]
MTAAAIPRGDGARVEEAPPPAPAPPPPPDRDERAQEQKGRRGSGVDVSDLLDEADRRGSAILLRRPDRISVSYYSPPPPTPKPPPSSRRRDEAEATKEAGSVDRGDEEVEIVEETIEEFESYPCATLSGLRLCVAPDGTVVVDSVRTATDEGFDARGATTTTSFASRGGVNRCSLLPGSRHSPTYFEAGDAVEYACGADCRREEGGRRASDSDDGASGETEPRQSSRGQSGRRDNIETALSRDAEAERFFAKVREYNAGAFVTTICARTTASRDDPVRLCQATILLKDRTDLDVQSLLIDSGVRFALQDERLVVKSISKKYNDGWFGSAGCALREGHVVVGINEYIASSLSPDDASSIIRDIVSSPTSTQLSITAIAAPRSSPKWSLRRAAVAAGGGTMVAAGSVLMVTPLHPVGHAVALGGVGVLGLEFEGPKNAAEKVKGRWKERRRRWAERRGSSSGGDDGEGGEGAGVR